MKKCCFLLVLIALLFISSQEAFAATPFDGKWKLESGWLEESHDIEGIWVGNVTNVEPSEFNIAIVPIGAGSSYYNILFNYDVIGGNKINGKGIKLSWNISPAGGPERAANYRIYDWFSLDLVKLTETQYQAIELAKTDVVLVDSNTIRITREYDSRPSLIYKYEYTFKRVGDTDPNPNPNPNKSGGGGGGCSTFGLSFGVLAFIISGSLLSAKRYKK